MKEHRIYIYLFIYLFIYVLSSRHAGDGWGLVLGLGEGDTKIYQNIPVQSHQSNQHLVFLSGDQFSCTILFNLKHNIA
jgi:hypothetical protein